MKTFCLLILCFILSTDCAESESKDRYLSIPIAEKCKTRFKEFQHKGHNYFFSGNHPELKDKKLDWLDSRNTCRLYCMETVSFETQDEFDFFKNYIDQHNISFVWTSGRLCDFEGCEGRWDLLPKKIKGWLWSANQARIYDTNKIPENWKYNPWSRSGHFKKPQPDNAEYYISQTQESCLGILNNQFNDSIGWHDIACYHKARFICEDSEILEQQLKDGDFDVYTGNTETKSDQEKVTTSKETEAPITTTTEEISSEEITTSKKPLIRKRIIRRRKPTKSAEQ